MKKGPAAFVILVSLLFSVFAFSVWFPSQIHKQYQIVKSKNQRENLLKKLMQPSEGRFELSQELLNDIKEKRGIPSSQGSDPLSDLVKRLDQFDEDYNLASEDILERKFHGFFGEGISPLDSEIFSVPQGLSETVQFWVKIFGEYDQNHVIFYDNQDVGLVYSVLDFSELGSDMDSAGKSIQQQMIAEEKDRVQRMIKTVTAFLQRKDVKQSDFDKLSPEEKRLFGLLQTRTKGAADPRMLLQTLSYRNGFSHRIRRALVLSGKYLPQMQKIFEQKGLPVELTMLPFIESAFNLKAYSSAGAAGVWQFILATGKRYLRIDDYVDERYDPILATYAAASHLSYEYKFLKSWPLTVNAYNTGPGRMLDAQKSFGNDIAKIIRQYKGSGYGFDSRNYYPEFLAMLHVYRNREHYFAEVQPLPLESYDYVVMPATTDLKELLRLAGTDTSRIFDLNLALRPEVLSGQRALPKGYLLKVPPKQKEDILYAAKELYADRLYASYHVVDRGEDLAQVAQKYDVSMEDLAKLNQILPGNRLKRGEVLRLPVEEFDTDLAFIRDGERQDLKVSEEDE